MRTTFWKWEDYGYLCDYRSSIIFVKLDCKVIEDDLVLKINTTCHCSLDLCEKRKDKNLDIRQAGDGHACTSDFFSFCSSIVRERHISLFL